MNLLGFFISHLENSVACTYTVKMKPWAIVTIGKNIKVGLLPMPGVDTSKVTLAIPTPFQLQDQPLYS